MVAGALVGGRGDAHPGPVVVAFAFSALAGRAPVPRPGGQPVGDVLDLCGAGGQGDPVVAGDGQDVADTSGLQVAAQAAFVAVELVRGRPSGGHTVVQRAGEHLARVGDLGGE